MVDAGDWRAAFTTEVSRALFGRLQRSDLAADIPELIDRYHKPGHVGRAAGAATHGAMAVCNRDVFSIKLVTNRPAETPTFSRHLIKLSLWKN